MIPEWADQLCARQNEPRSPTSLSRRTGGAQRYPSSTNAGVDGYRCAHPSYEYIQKSQGARATHACEQAFRNLLEFRGNVLGNVMFYPRSIEED